MFSGDVLAEVVKFKTNFVYVIFAQHKQRLCILLKCKDTAELKYCIRVTTDQIIKLCIYTAYSYKCALQINKQYCQLKPVTTLDLDIPPARRHAAEVWNHLFLRSTDRSSDTGWFVYYITQKVQNKQKTKLMRDQK